MENMMSTQDWVAYTKIRKLWWHNSERKNIGNNIRKSFRPLFVDFDSNSTFWWRLLVGSSFFQDDATSPFVSALKTQNFPTCHRYDLDKSNKCFSWNYNMSLKRRDSSPFLCVREQSTISTLFGWNSSFPCLTKVEHVFWWSIFLLSWIFNNRQSYVNF